MIKHSSNSKNKNYSMKEQLSKSKKGKNKHSMKSSKKKRNNAIENYKQQKKKPNKLKPCQMSTKNSSRKGDNSSKMMMKPIP